MVSDVRNTPFRLKAASENELLFGKARPLPSEAIWQGSASETKQYGTLAKIFL